jgi:hypothetical protein
MADDKHARPVAFLNREYRFHRLTHTISDMTPEAASVAKDIARSKFAIPARNRTYRVLIVSVSAVAICWLALEALKSAPAAMAQVLGIAASALGAAIVIRGCRKN